MAERPNTKNHGQLLGLAHLQELPQVALAAPVENALCFLDMIPEHVAGDDRHPTLLHLPHFISPFGSRNTGVVHLAHYRTDTVPVDHQAILVP